MIARSSAVEEQPTNGRAPRRRRSQDEVRRLLLDAARRHFADDGYAGASVRAIAADAGVARQLVTNHFGSKAGLFEAAVLEPFTEFIREFNNRRHVPLEEEDVFLRTRDFVAGMVDLLQEHRQLLLTVLIEGARDPAGPTSGLREARLTLAPLVHPISELGHRANRDFAWEGLDFEMLARATQGMIVSQILLDNLWFDGPERPTREFLIEQMTRLLVDGYRGPKNGELTAR